MFNVFTGNSIEEYFNVFFIHQQISFAPSEGVMPFSFPFFFVVALNGIGKGQNISFCWGEFFPVSF